MQQRSYSLLQLQQWTVHAPWTRPASRLDLSSFALWGPMLTRKLLQWLVQLQWPSIHDAPDEFGVTWLKLACSFWLTVGCFFPAKRRDQRGVWRVVHIDNYAKATLYQVKFSEQAKMRSQWIDQVGDLIDSRVLPDIPRGLVRSLYMVVSGIQSSGVKRRPSFPFQSDVMRVLHDYTSRPTGHNRWPFYRTLH